MNQPYSKKVMELFTNPKNMGEIKNADGVGVVGNQVCLVLNSKIHLKDYLENIQNINVGYNVLSHTGNYEKVINISRVRHNKRIIKFKNKLGELSVTPEHLIFAVKVPKKRKFFDHKVKKNLTPAWYHANELEKRDIVLYPVLKEVKDVKEISIEIEKPKYDFKSFKLPPKVKIDADFLRLCGYFLAEGHIRKAKCNNHIGFSFNIDEKKYYEDVIKIVKLKFGLNAKLELRKARNTAVVLVYSAPLAKFFEQLFNKGAKNKKMPHFMMLLPSEKQKHLIKGLWRGDGCVNINREYPRAGYVTISYELANQIKTILLRLKIVPSIYTEEEKIIREVKHQKAYRIHIGDKPSLRKLCNILNIKMNYNKQEKTHSWFDKNYLYTPITNMQREGYKGYVYNFEVENAHSYTTDAFCVHNCGDIMKVYIKVKDNKIKDIKFQTYGCVSAIATSSMITEMAKGKTLEEAMKITRGDVADSLGGLPPLKMHCSNLAADALKAAIEDYKKKAKK